MAFAWTILEEVELDDGYRRKTEAYDAGSGVFVMVTTTIDFVDSQTRETKKAVTSTATSWLSGTQLSGTDIIAIPVVP